jgi:hypothetical protein
MSRLAISVVCAAAVAWALSGCEQFRTRDVDPKPMGYEELQSKAQTKQSRDDAGPKPVERNVIETPVTGEATNPRKCYELYRQAVKTRDCDACWNLLSGPSRDAYESEASDLKVRVVNSFNPSSPDVEILGVLGLTRKDVDKLTGKMYLSGSMQREAVRNPEALDEITRTEFDHESIWGDKARVYVRVPTERQPVAMNLLREGGIWRIDMRPAKLPN